MDILRTVVKTILKPVIDILNSKNMVQQVLNILKNSKQLRIWKMAKFGNYRSVVFDRKVEKIQKRRYPSVMFQFKVNQPFNFFEIKQFRWIFRYYPKYIIKISS